MAVTDIYRASAIPGNVSGTVSTYNGISIREIAGSEGTEKTDGTGNASRKFLLEGSDDPRVCRSALKNGPVLIDIYDGMARESIKWDRIGFGKWEFTVSYSTLAPEAGAYTVSIDTQGGQILQTYAFDQSSFPATGLTAPDYGNAIDVQDKKPQGVQRIIPALKINVRAKIATQFLGASPLAYAKVVSSLTGTYNSSPMFNGQFAPGELLFTGGSGEIVAEEPSLTFSFLSSANVSGLTIGDIAGINKYGHDYLWFTYYEDKDATTGLPVAKPRAAYVSRVYGPGNHNLLYIGVAGSG